MLTTIDRQLIVNYLKAYLFCMVSLLGMYVVIDLFMNLDDFSHPNDTFVEALEHIGLYYTFKLTLIFDKLCEAIALLAAMFTIAWLQRHNELLPLLSAGVSTRRVVMPVLLAAILTLGLSILNQELVLPRIDSFLVEHRSDPEGEKESAVKGGYDVNDVHLSARRAYKKELLIKEVTVVIPHKHGEGLTHLQAKEGRYLPPAADVELSGGWMLHQTTPAELDNMKRFDELGLVLVEPGQYFLRTSYVDFDVMTRSKHWFVYESTWRLLELMGHIDSTQLASIAVIFHQRLTRPLLGVVLVILGLSMILRDQNRNIFISAGLCVVLGGIFYASCIACKYLGEYEHLSPALAAWLPVLSFGPLSFVMYDAVHT
jgi:lipopolysaccharide export system permease protein